MRALDAHPVAWGHAFTGSKGSFTITHFRAVLSGSDTPRNFFARSCLSGLVAVTRRKFCSASEGLKQAR